MTKTLFLVDKRMLKARPNKSSTMPTHLMLVVQKCGGGLQVYLLLVSYTGTLHQLSEDKIQN